MLTFLLTQQDTGQKYYAKK